MPQTAPYLDRVAEAATRRRELLEAADRELDNAAAAGARRRELLEAADRELDALAGILEAAGDSVNLVHASDVARVPRSTIYRRLAARRAHHAS